MPAGCELKKLKPVKFEMGEVIRQGVDNIGGRDVYCFWVVTDPDEFNAFANSKEAAKTGLAYFPGYTAMTHEQYQQYLQELE